MRSRGILTSVCSLESAGMEKTLFTWCLLNVLVIQPTFTLNCYTCDVIAYRQNDKYIAAISPQTLPSVECDHGIKQCYTNVVTKQEGALMFITRGCQGRSDVSECIDVTGDIDTCSVTFCDADNCNNKAVHTSSSNMAEDFIGINATNDTTEPIDNPTTASTTIATTTTPPTTTPGPTPNPRYIWCHNCTHNYGDTPDNAPSVCEINPQATPESNIQCSRQKKHGCYTRRIEKLGDKVLMKLQRGCEEVENPEPENEYNCPFDAVLKTCTTYCTTDFCNEDSGYPTPAVETTPTKRPTTRKPNHNASVRAQSDDIYLLILHVLTYVLVT